MEKKLVGGQAVIEGVMMRCENKVATAVRKGNSIKVKKEKISSISDKYRILKWPFVRGIVNLIELLIIGIKTLEYSAQEASGKKEQISKTAMALTIVIALVFGIVIFVLIPYILTTVLGFKEQSMPLGFNLVDGLFRLAMLVGYVILIGSFKDIRRVFEYHGAEHKAVACFEHGKTLNVKNCRKYSTKHTRCGTSFLMFVILVGIVLFSFVPLAVSSVSPGIMSSHGFLRYATLFLSRILILPIISGIAYEILRISARYEDSKLVKPILLPGLYVQKLTTREPDDKQVEVAIKALKAVI
ncbi:MAG: DUF1385 domain-containing protein [Candidatus Woesearchaeota archaeon]